MELTFKVGVHSEEIGKIYSHQKIFRQINSLVKKRCFHEFFAKKGGRVNFRKFTLWEHLSSHKQSSPIPIPRPYLTTTSFCFFIFRWKVFLIFFGIILRSWFNEYSFWLQFSPDHRQQLRDIQKVFQGYQISVSIKILH